MTEAPQQVRVTDKRGQNKKAPEAEAEMLSPQEQQELLAQQVEQERQSIEEGTQYQGGGMRTAPDSPPLQGFVTAFSVVLRHDGAAVAMPLTEEQTAGMGYRLDRDATLSDMIKASHEIISDIQAHVTATSVVTQMMAMQQQMAQQQQAARLAQTTGLRR